MFPITASIIVAFVTYIITFKEDFDEKDTNIVFGTISVLLIIIVLLSLL